MNGVSMTFGVVGLFLALYAVFSLLRAARRDHGGRAASLGCGFTLLAGVIWGVALSQLLGDRRSGLRLGLGLAFALPALVAIVRPVRRHVVVATVLLLIGVALAAPELPKLARRLRPSQTLATAHELRKGITELEERIASGTAYLTWSQAERAKLKADIKRLGVQTFADVERRPEALQLLREWRDIERLEAATTTRIETARAELERLRIASRRVERLSASEAVLGADLTVAELRRILDDAKTTPPSTAPPLTVEAHVEQQQLQALFEREMN